MRVTVRETEKDKLFELLSLAYGLQQLAKESEGVFVQDVRDGMFVYECPLSKLLQTIGQQLTSLLTDSLDGPV
jgi:hypothetical protein